MGGRRGKVGGDFTSGLSSLGFPNSADSSSVESSFDILSAATLWVCAAERSIGRSLSHIAT